ncbi:cryptochrome/photolyase family protein [Janthinobacterium sp. PLB04]|uniref:Cryptochrome/photolyase family protein n=1 Tax=Janthinobacterium lividum TaxID=29581 RepID=A0AAJ4T3I6_9BURK|nr:MULTISPECIES: cryptochrome/photolyase family protein [Janthinobacterium]KAB0325383.1 cryptochrome/photolyase family protein [Janthinobacterium lividum]QSX94475.1 cryptochrome/photolyase family protein [Janthinobacterium lividum]UGQ34261.1 cryptochrome/photolyase family protein [Janthinobacterium sp. PLB04]
MTSAKPTLRLILGDQLNAQHRWFTEVDGATIYVLMEVRQETDYVLHHAQKILAIFAAMRDMARQLRQLGHTVHYIAIDDMESTRSIPENIEALIRHYDACAFEYQAPDEWRLDQQLYQSGRRSGIPWLMVDSDHFYTARHEAADIFAGRKQWLMEFFYRQMRSKHQVLMEDAKKPVGGQWNFDHDNRKPWRGTPAEPQDARTVHDHSRLWQSIVAAGVKSFGAPHADRLAWALNRGEALQQLDAFIERALPHFGDFQDAMSVKAWRLFHSLLSFALNVKMLNPREVVARAQAAYQAGHAPLAAVEGFIRQILGWREYVRGVYWAHMPGYAEKNFFGHARPLPSWFWDGKTKMHCLSQAITQSLEQAHAHHIQRLMVIGNFALLAGLDPARVHGWYLGIYIDAFEWVELPNTVGMSQFADGGLLATKPYVSSAAYIDRMGDYCKGCHYDKKARIGERACPFNALYWDFFHRNADTLERNPRIGMAYRQLEKMDEATVAAFRQQAATMLARLDSL